MRSDAVDRAPRRRVAERATALMTHYAGPATISDGVHDSTLDVEIHIRPGKNAVVAAWHVTIRGRLPQELRSPFGKALSVILANGSRGVGTLIDPLLIRGAGEPPSL